MGQSPSVPNKTRRKSLRSFRSPFPRRASSRQGSNLSAAFSIMDNNQPVELLNINLATEEELMTLPGVTRKIAHDIVNHRRLIGRYKKVEDLALVPGVGAEKLQLIKPEICVNKRRMHSCASSRAQSMDSLKSTDSSRLTFRGVTKVVDINRANVFDLQCIHGVTQELAANIVHYREKRGPFKTVDELIKVKGMNNIRLGSLRAQLTLNSDISSLPEDSVSIKTLNNVSLTNGNAANVNGLMKSAVTKKPNSVGAGKGLVNNGLSTTSIQDIFELLSAYSYRPIVEEEFKYERNNEKAVRIATWNLHELSFDKAENLGFKEVVCRTILENKFSIIAVQEVLDAAALRIICDELNRPTLRRVSEWKDNSQDWNFCMADDPSSSLGFIYDYQSGGLEVELVTLRQMTLESSPEPSEALLGTFHVGDVTVSILNVCLQTHIDNLDNVEKVHELVNHDDELFMLAGDFTGIRKNIEKGLSTVPNCLNILPPSTNTSSVAQNLHHTSPHFYDNILLMTSNTRRHNTGVWGIVRQGLTHLAIPHGWSWGGPASDHCPIWCEMFTQIECTVQTDL